MWSVKRILSLLSCLLPLAAASTVLALEAPATVEGKASWKGDVTLRQMVVVPADAVLTIVPGTIVRPLTAEARLIVHGVLKALGTAKAPIAFVAPDSWQGIELVEAAEGSVFEHVRFAKAQNAISSTATPFVLRHCSFRDGGTAVKLLREANPLIEDCLFANNDMGIDSEMKSVPLIRRNRFQGHKTTAILASHNAVGLIEGNLFEKNKQGIGLLQKYPDRIVGNRFVENEVGIYCNQTQDTPTIKANTFEKNKFALVNLSFAYPKVEDNTFVGNETAIRNDQYSPAQIVNNLFRQNKTALYNYRKSNVIVEKNVFDRNGQALFCDFSSYPKVKNNNFLGNRMGVELGIYQSSDWEKRSGSKGIVQQEAAARQSKNPIISQAPTEFSDFVDVSGNWWGDDTGKLAAVGKDGNVAIFFDRQDKPKVVYEGYGEESYVLDRVVFSPWLTAPVRDAGPVREK